MILFKKLRCNHKWEEYDKKEYKWEQLEFDGNHIYSSTYVIFICKECGKIKKIKY